MDVSLLIQLKPISHFFKLGLAVLILIHVSRCPNSVSRLAARRAYFQKSIISTTDSDQIDLGVLFPYLDLEQDPEFCYSLKIKQFTRIWNLECEIFHDP